MFGVRLKTTIFEDSVQARARLKKLCDNIINRRPRWFSDAGIAKFLDWVKAWREGDPLTEQIAELDNYLQASFDNEAWQFHVRPPWQYPSQYGRVDDTAMYLFAAWYTNPLRDRLGGPCPGRRNGQACDKYYVWRRTVPQKYCSRDCGKDAAAMDVYANQRKQKLDKAREAIQRWENMPAKTRKMQWINDWTRFVCKECKGITRNFLSFAVNQKKDLTPPKGET